MNNSRTKIGIMTWYTYKNYGTALQAGALSYILHKLGYEPFFIQYIPKGNISMQGKISFPFILRKIIAKITSFKNSPFLSQETEQLFVDFLQKRIKETPLCRTYSELYGLNTEYDAFVCGSDQIWSPLCYDDKYFLSFVSNPNKMMAYAPSIGSTEIQNDVIRNKMAQHILRFKYLSIREQQGADLIEQLTGKVATVVLDPSLLMSASEWDKFADISESNHAISGDYILCYFLGNEKRYMDYVRRLSNHMNMPFYVIPTTIKQKESQNAIPFATGPGEFISLVKHARYVCTDSFHGTVFSIIYHIPFSVFKRFAEHDSKNQNSRIISLLNLLKISDRLVEPSDKIDGNILGEGDFSRIDAHLAIQRRQSLQYLSGTIKEMISVRSTPSFSYKITDVCCGCGACAAECPTNAVIVCENTQGFFHYTIDKEKCVRCGKCQTVCPMTGIIAPEIRDSIALYSVKSNSENTLKISSSGGVGHELAELCLTEGCYVGGCMYDSSDNRAKHIVVNPNESESIVLLQGSKYIQSNSQKALKCLSKMAVKDTIVFFGTPCQVAALDKLLRMHKVREQGLLVDLICHGVPSYLLWDKYIQEIEQKYHTGNHPKVLFRNKTYGWRQRRITVTGSQSQYEKEEHKDDFYAFFRRSLLSMEACYDCPYREKSAADLRIGDYWGARFEGDHTGVSMVIANTQKGNGYVQKLTQQKKCTIQEHALQEYWEVQYPYNQQKPLIREQLIKELKENTNLHELRKKYCHTYDVWEKYYNVYQKVKQVLKRG